MELERYEIESGDVTLVGEHRPAAGSDTLIVFCHGIPLSKPDSSDGGYPELTARVAREGFSTLFFNLRGTGESGGDFAMDGWYDDLRTVMGFASGGLLRIYERLLLAGFSAGGSISIRYAAEHGGLAGVAAFAPVADFGALFGEDQVRGFIDVAKDVGIIRDPEFPGDISGFYAGMRANGALGYVEAVSPTPLLLVHGEMDQVVPPASSEALYRRAAEPKELVVIPGAEHRLRREPRTVEVLLTWIKNPGVRAQSFNSSSNSRGQG